VLEANGFSFPSDLERHPWNFQSTPIQRSLPISKWQGSFVAQMFSYAEDVKYEDTMATTADGGYFKKYFKPYRSDSTTRNVCRHSDTGIRKCVISNGYLSFRIGLAPGYIINPAKCNGKAVPVMGNIKRCIPCKPSSPRYCTGRHECRFPAVRTKIAAWATLNFVPEDVKAKIAMGDSDATVLEVNQTNTAENTPIFDTRAYMNDRSAIRSLVSLLGNFLLEANNRHNKYYTSVSELPIYTREKESWNTSNLFHAYRPDEVVQYEISLPDVVDKSDSASSRCSITTKQGQPTSVFKLNYSACNFSSQFEHLSALVGTHKSSGSPFRIPEGIVIPPSTRIAYLTSKKMMITDGIPSWSKASRQQSDVFVQDLLDQNTQCKHASMKESICSLHQNQLYVMNPWMGGAFNVFESDEGMQDGGCDTTFLDKYLKSDIASDSSIQLDSLCSVPSTCGGAGSEEERNWYRNIPQVCRTRQSLPERIPTIDASSKHNLCTVKPKAVPSICQHPQGMMYGYAGKPWGDLYASASAAQTFGNIDVGGIFENPMAAGRRHPRTSYGLIRSEPHEIAGHYVSYKITKDNRLIVDKIPLNAASAPTDQPSSILQAIEGSTIPWLTYLADDILGDVQSTKHMHHDSSKASNAHWSCPLREVLLWSGQYAGKFPASVPWLPNPQRVGRMYSRLLTPFSTQTNTMWAHPTTKSNPIRLSMLHTGYWTTNGFCVYRGNAIFQSHTSEACSLAQLARSVWDDRWRNFSVSIAGGQKCTEQVDWPYMEFVGRDGTQNPGTPPSDCAVLDRLSVFQYKIQTTQPVYFSPDISSKKKTTSGGGVCNMGRAARRTGSGTDCWKIADTSTGNVMRCKNVNSGQQDIQWLKKPIKTPYLMVNQSMRRRQKCNQCSPPPRFVYQHNTSVKSMPAPEVGYGRPFKWETARMLAGDLRFFLCSNATECPHIQADVWTLEHFLQRYFKAPADLLANVSVKPNTSSLEDIIREHDHRHASEAVEGYVDPYEKYLWEQEAWVICTQNGSNCSGTMSKSQWMDDRVGQCSSNVASFLDENPESLAINIDLCNINGQMDSVCKDMLNSILRISNINCMLSGKDTCLEKSFFYTPALFSSSNQQFIRDTVNTFYQRFDAGVCAADSRTKDLMAQNSMMASKCAAVALEPLRKGLIGARDVVDMVMNILFDILMITTDLMQLIVAGAESAQVLTQDIFYWFQQLIFDMGRSLEQIGNVIYQALLEVSPLGSSFRNIVEVICSFVEFLMNTVWTNFLCYIMKILVPIVSDALVILLGFIQAVINVISAIASLFNQKVAGADAILEATRVIYKVRNFVMSNMQCGKNYNFNCVLKSSNSTQSPSLPVATRCWAGFQPDASDASILSCTRADTCYQEGLSGTGASVPIVCDACPRTVAEDFLPCACSPLTKRCTCGVQKYERTRCTTHEQCYSGVQGASCMRVSTPFSKAYSTVPCKQCPTQPVCIVTSGSSPGKCLFDLLCF
jgi:hypothetical protein